MSTALYRRYRPETFADVIGQEHVTEPLMAAIDKDRINHAYLFSGPRGCGKTTSARILARCLNCAQGPTSTPCGTCDSCVELARNGSGSLDVIEIDAASHGGVDDARDLRERATFAPVRDRFKIFIIDEAHMVTSAGFNALLKIVEEPPEHILFIFATTEPDKVIGTIRSRTHHYPFRLVPPEPLMAYLEQLCRQENVPVAPGVLSLVIRAGGGSVRDSLSVLDQLMAGAGENGLDYELAVSLLGYTHATLLDDVVESVAAGDAATVFNAVDRVIQTGHDPRRFVEDLLERFRDLIVINAVPEGAASILRGVPDDQLNRMRSQANQLGAGELSRAADVTNTALTEMTGATSPRLHLELLCARLLLPAADATVRGTLARVDRIERRLEYAGGAPVPEAGTPADDVPKAPARPRLDVPRTAEEAAARWSLPAADPAAPAVPAAAPGAHSPAVPAASRVNGSGAAATADSSPDWGGSWGVSTDSAFADPEPKKGGATQQPTAGGPSGTSGQAAPAPGAPATPGSGTTTDRPADARSHTTGDPAARAASPETSAQPVAPAPLGAQHDGQAPTGDLEQRASGAGQPSGADRRSGAADGPTAEAPARGGDTAPSWGAPAQPQGRKQSPAQASPHQGPAQPQQDSAQHGSAQHGSAQPGSAQHGSAQPGSAQPQQGPVQPQQGPQVPAQPQQGARRPEPVQTGQTGAPAPSGGSGGSVEMIRRAWPEIMDEVAHIKRATWLIVNVSAKPRSFEGNQLVLAFANQGNAIGFQRGPHMDNVKQAIHKVLGLTCSIEAVHDAGGAGESGPKVPARQAAPDSNPGLGTPAPPVDRGAASGAGGARRGDAQAPAGAPVEPQPTPGGTRRGDAQAPAGAPVEPQPTPAASVAPPAAAAAPPAAPSTPAPSGGAGGAGVTGGPAPSSSTPTRSGSHQATRPAPGGPRPADMSDPQGGSAGDGRPRRTSAPEPRRDDTRRPGRAAASAEAPAPEAVSAWDPSMSDDSWALVEPPEEAFDPGGDWGSVPEDPYDRRPREPQRAEARPAGAPPARGGGSGDAMQASASAPAPAPAPKRGPEAAPAAPMTGPAAEAAPSRSVVWSPPVAATPPASPAAATPSSPVLPRGLAGAGPRGPVPDGSHRSAGPVVAPGPGATPAPNGVVTAPDRPAPAENIRQKPISRYQQLLDEAERKRAEEASAARGAVDRRFVEDEPSADDETIEESGLVGRTAIERILNGRLVEERSIDGQ
ncbi:DNA polymerase III subunit gamma and tau [Arthrobacter agilis]|uniref:DNA polymerase III subunit gamma and tau n=1 Tax=Arthrobacter agilis TaxID=37921 RepID=UPI00278B3D9D|nr:DNA polymerase III subunit gamma and tau [Arthrobacter agilis]MDQ0737004.1 DNA polymerase-3 subunit gamma/tau [Arthrobacter agilis]